MNRRYVIIGTIVATFALALGSMAVLAKETEEKEEEESQVTWDNLPHPVQQAIQTQFGTDTPDEFSKEVEDGFIAFEATGKIDGQSKEIKISEDGQLLEVETEVDTTQLPDAVSDWIQKEAAGADIEELRHVQLHFYEIKVKKDGRTRELKILGNGQELEDDD